jgi:hypothetical protein
MAQSGHRADGGFVRDGRKRKPRDGEVEREALFEEIGRLKMELDWLQKKADLLD